MRPVRVAWFNKSLRPRKPEGSLGRTTQDVHIDSHTSPDPRSDTRPYILIFLSRQINTWLSRQNTSFVSTKVCLRRQTFCRDEIFFCRDIYLCLSDIRFVATSIHLSLQKTCFVATEHLFVATKMILVAASAIDTPHPTSTPLSPIPLRRQ